MAATVVMNVASLARPHLLKILTDQVLTGASLDGKSRLLVTLLGALLGLTLVKTLFTFVQGVALIAACQGTVRDLRDHVYARVLRMPLAWFDRQRAGDLGVRLGDDARIAADSLTTGFTILANDSVILVVSVAWMLTRDWQLTVVGMGVMPLAGFVTRRFASRLQEASRRAQARISDLGSMVAETVTGIRVVKAFSKEEHEGDRFTTQNDGSFREAMRIVQYTATQSPIVEMLVTAGICLVLWYCAVKIVAGALTFGDLLAFWAYMLLATTPIHRLPKALTDIHRGRVALERLLELAEARLEDEASALPDLPPVQGGIALRGVRFRYAESREEVLRDLDLTIEAGTHVGLVGRNGTGKSTLVGLLARFYVPEAGDIRIDGHDITGVSLASLRRQLGVVSQDPMMFAGTVRENIAYARPGASEEAVMKAARDAGAHDTILSLADGYDTVLGERGAGLSGGQRQRIALARVLLQDPPLILLDEATANVDPQAESELHAMLETRLRGRTVISIAHRLAIARRMDRIVVLEGGRVAEDGTHDALLARRGIYASLHESARGDSVTSPAPGES